MKSWSHFCFPGPLLELVGYANKLEVEVELATHSLRWRRRGRWWRRWRRRWS